MTDCYDGFFLDTRYVLVDRDTKFLPFRGVLEGSDASGRYALSLPSWRLESFTERSARLLGKHFVLRSLPVDLLGSFRVALARVNVGKEKIDVRTVTLASAHVFKHVHSAGHVTVLAQIEGQSVAVFGVVRL